MQRVVYMVLCAICAFMLGGVPAQADEMAGFSFDPGSVRFGYADGYWDHEHRWHGWPSAKEAREFRRRHQDRIYGYRHTRYPNEGWREATQVRGALSREKRDAEKDPSS